MTDILEKQTPETQPDGSRPEACSPKYPVALMNEYRALTDKYFAGSLSEQKTGRLQEIKDEISAIDLASPRAYVPEYDLDKIRAEIDQLERDIAALPTE